MKISKKGFTIIELIVVIAIIAVLSGIIVSNVMGYESRARDAKRLADIHNLVTALNLYYTNHGQYPSYTQPSGYNGPIPNCWGLSDAETYPDGPRTEWQGGNINNPSPTFLPELVTDKIMGKIPIETLASLRAYDGSICTYAYARISDICGYKHAAVLFVELENPRPAQGIAPQCYQDDIRGFDEAHILTDPKGYVVFLPEPQ